MNKMLIVTEQTVYQVDCDADVEVPDDGVDYKVADLVFAAGLQKTKDLDQAHVPPGKYVVKMMAVVTAVTDEDEG